MLKDEADDNIVGNPPQPNEKNKLEICEICYEERPPLDMFSLSCRHRYCKDVCFILFLSFFGFNSFFFYILVS